MNDALIHTAFFGDAERKFLLTYPLILELEQKTRVGIGGLAERLFSRNFGIADISEVIRLALIGGGETPERAEQLVSAYVRERPLTETLPIAIAIMEACFFGVNTEQKESDE